MSHRDRVSLAAVALLLVASVAPASAQQTGRPFVRAQLVPARGVTVGQRVELAIDLFVPTWFTTPPDLPPLDVPDAFVVALTTTSRVTEQVGSDTWGGVRYSYAITPQAAGTLQVPAVALTFQYAVDARPSGPFTVHTAALPLPVRLPPGAEALDYFFAAPALHLSQHFDPHTPATLSVGEAFSRRISLAADDVNGLTLPPVDLASPDGLRVTIEPPVMTTTGDAKAGTRVTRTQRMTYIAERPGHYVLPAITVPYWSTSANALRRATLPAVTFEVGAAPAFQEEIALPPEPEIAPAVPSRWAVVRRIAREWWRVALVAIVAAVVLSWAWRRLMPRLRTRLAEAQRRRAESESHYFGQVRHAASSGDLRATYAAALTWVARLPQLKRTPTLAALVTLTGDQALGQSLARVDASLYGRRDGREAAPAAADLLAGLERARRVLLRRPATHEAAHGLVPLNPSRAAVSVPRPPVGTRARS